MIQKLLRTADEAYGGLRASHANNNYASVFSKGQRGGGGPALTYSTPNEDRQQLLKGAAH